MCNWPTVDLHEIRMNGMIGHNLLSSVINKKERETWKVQ